MDIIRITSARILRLEPRTETVRLSIEIPREKIEEVRKLLKEQFHADGVYLMYETTSSTNGSQPATKT